ncbi:hypothetical protein [Nonomuraea sp. LPB2021202275-12-8]|uniref:hypothetical protein n=1 Tax=Nonomuraea sp. LPB2021202275-12-8 TaxID=3120159 RepID=UPI003FA5E570
MAQLAYVSTEYYTRPEQARAPRPSREVLAGHCAFRTPNATTCTTWPAPRRARAARCTAASWTCWTCWTGCRRPPRWCCPRPTR